MRDDEAEYALMAGWLDQPHVKYFWDPDLPPATSDYVRDNYGPSADPLNTPCIIQTGGRPVGFIQFYRWTSYPKEVGELGLDVLPDDWGIDVLIGEPDAVGIGVGTSAVDLLCRYLEHELDAQSVILLTDVHNERAQRAYEKAGFIKERVLLDLDTRDGERIHSFVMRRR
ncbi:MAG: acetyltransferase [Candidatus Dormibacteraeota bacterium]|nr:acetyltransferase [Candidatus Dormibacteraeota bacterium]